MLVVVRNEPPTTAPVWDDAPWTALPPLAGTVQAQVCVIGLGGSGLTALAALAERGVRAVGIDAGAVGGGAAGRNGGFLLAGLAEFHHDVAARLGAERAAALYRATMTELERIAVETPEAVRRTGSLRLAVDDDELADCERQLAAMRRDGLPVEPYDGPAGQGLRFPGDACLQPLRRCRILATRLVDAGAMLHEHTPATRLDGTSVVTPRGRIDADAVVVAVDGRLELLLPELAGRVRTARAQMLATAPAAPLAEPIPTYARWGYDYWQQLPDGRVALGGGRDVGGEDEWTAAQEPSAPVQAHLERLLRERLGVRAPVTYRWAGAIAFTDDKLPVLERVRPGVWVAGAYSGTGNVVGALCGRAAALRAVGQAASDLRRLLTGEETAARSRSREGVDAPSPPGSQ
jgi:gamma-glutamylputrescine oxidase